MPGASAGAASFDVQRRNLVRRYLSCGARYLDVCSGCAPVAWSRRAVRMVSAVVDMTSQSRPPAMIVLAPSAAIRGAVRAIARAADRAVGLVCGDHGAELLGGDRGRQDCLPERGRSGEGETCGFRTDGKDGERGDEYPGESQRYFQGRCCVVGSAGAPSPGLGVGQIAWASSMNAAATRSAGGMSRPSSYCPRRRFCMKA